MTTKISVHGISYEQVIVEQRNFKEIMLGNHSACVIYESTDDIPEDNQICKRWLVTSWKLNEDNIAITASKMLDELPSRIQELDESADTIGEVAILSISLPSGNGVIKGKVDTGADISSLHGDNIKRVGGNVQFTNSHLSSNILSFPIVDEQAVKTADNGVEYRPVIELDIEINGKSLKRMAFNINDRSNMEYPCLIGQNVLDKAHFLIDTTMKEATEVDYDTINKLIKDEPDNIKPAALNSEQIEKARSIICETANQLNELLNQPQ